MWDENSEVMLSWVARQQTEQTPVAACFLLVSFMAYSLTCKMEVLWPRRPYFLGDYDGCSQRDFR